MAIGHRGRQAGVSRTPFLAADVDGTPARRVASKFRRPGAVRNPNTGKTLTAIAVVWLATMGMAIAAPAASTWSLLPQPAAVRLARSGAVKIADGALVAVRGADRQHVQPMADRFTELVANTRGLQLHRATLLARLPLAPAVRGDGQNELNARVSTSKLNDARNLCIFATGDPRAGQRALARVAFSK